MQARSEAWLPMCQPDHLKHTVVRAAAAQCHPPARPLLRYESASRSTRLRPMRDCRSSCTCSRAERGGAERDEAGGEQVRGAAVCGAAQRWRKPTPPLATTAASRLCWRQPSHSSWQEKAQAWCGVHLRVGGAVLAQLLDVLLRQLVLRQAKTHGDLRGNTMWGHDRVSVTQW